MVKDKYGNTIKIGDIYDYIFGGPGPDVTTLVIIGINDDGTVKTYDIWFDIELPKVNAIDLMRATHVGEKAEGKIKECKDKYKIN